MFSNDVLEHEINQLKLQIAQSKSPSVTDSLNDRLISFQTQLALLITAVQTNQMDLDAYLNQINQSVSHSVGVVKALMGRGRIADAKLVMERIKIMKNEVQQAEEHRDELEE